MKQTNGIYHVSYPSRRLVTSLPEVAVTLVLLGISIRDILGIFPATATIIQAFSIASKKERPASLKTWFKTIVKKISVVPIN